MYEELLSKGASDQGSGAGQDFTPRELIKAIVDVVKPTPKDSAVDPACGTGGFLLFAHDSAARNAENLTPPERDHLRDSFAHGFDISDGTAPLAAMNLLLHGIGTPDGESLIEVRDALLADPGKRWPLVLTNPPFGKKSSITMVGAGGREALRIRSGCDHAMAVDRVTASAWSATAWSAAGRPSHEAPTGPSGRGV